MRRTSSGPPESGGPSGSGLVLRSLYPRLVCLLVLGTLLVVACVQPPSAPPTPPAEPTEPAPPPTPPLPRATAIPVDPSIVVWSADMETGDLSQWTVQGTDGGPQDSGTCIRPPDGVTTEAAHAGQYALKMSIDVSKEESGCRQFRHEESARGGEYYYSAWMMIPNKVTVDGYWNIFQFKSDNGSMNEAVWVLEARNRRNGNLHLELRWKGLVRGPTKKDGLGVKYYDQVLRDIPIGRWFHVEVFLRQSDNYNGRITVWQDGVRLWDYQKVKTQYPGGNNLWSINSYGNGIKGGPPTVYVDDAMITKSRVSASPGFLSASLENDKASVAVRARD